MEHKVLIAYASKAGSTAEVADAIRGVLSQAGLAVEVRKVQDVRDLSPYDSVVLGTAIRMEKPVSEAVDFVKKHRAALSQKTVAVYSVGITMREDTPENKGKAMSFLAPLLENIDDPVSVGIFAGKVDYSKLSPFWRLLASQDKSGLMREGDWRDWDAIRKWAGELVPKLEAA